VRNYLLHLRERGVALGTFKPHHGGIQFLFCRTLDREWSLFSKKESGREASALRAQIVSLPQSCAWAVRP
jgi:hypothetical protein